MRRSISLRVCTPPLWREAFPQASKPCSAICCLRKRKATHHACSTAWTRRPPALCSHPGTDGGERRWYRAERIGNTDKLYLALIEGQPLYDFTVARRLDTDTRNKTRVRHTDDPDPVRHTDVTLLAPLTAGDVPGLVESDDPDAPLMLVGCRIRKGARHQIRRISPPRGTRWPEIPSMGAELPCPSGFLCITGGSRFPISKPFAFPAWLPLLPREAQEKATAFLGMERE